MKNTLKIATAAIALSSVIKPRLPVCQDHYAAEFVFPMNGDVVHFPKEYAADINRPYEIDISNTLFLNPVFELFPGHLLFVWHFTPTP